MTEGSASTTEEEVEIMLKVVLYPNFNFNFKVKIKMEKNRVWCNFCRAPPVQTFTELDTKRFYLDLCKALCFTTIHMT